MMKVLLLGSGGREHAMAWKLKQSQKLKKLYIAPGNAGTSALGVNLPIDVSDFSQLREAVIEKDINLVVVGPEQPLVDGLADYFLQDKLLREIPVIGPAAEGAKLEGSKAFAKAFMQRHSIPTARYLEVSSESLEEGIAFLHELEAPYVLKADGLAAGKGVLIIDDKEEAEQELKNMLAGKFGKASRVVVIEEYLSGIELSCFVITDGSSYKMLPSAKDYKRIGINDSGPNTGGMGAVSPVVFADKVFMEKVENSIIIPTIEGLQKDNIPYKGFIFFGIMNVDGAPYVIEYNVRLGDPEAECILPRIKSDFAALLDACANGSLDQYMLEIDDAAAVTVVIVSGGYPGDYEKNKPIEGLEDISNCLTFHSGTSVDVSSGGYKTNGGRVLALTALGYSIEEAKWLAMENAEKIQFEGAYFRNDIADDLLRYRTI